MRSVRLGLWLALVLAAGAATGDPLVYHSPGDTGFKPTQAIVIPKASSVPLYLWIDPGLQAPSGAVCNNATGDASCAYDLRVEATGGATLVSFAPTGGGGCDIGCNLTGSMLRVNRIFTSSTALIGKQRLGVLTVNTTALPQEGLVQVTGVHSVGAARQLQPISHNPIARVLQVPEPGMLVLLFSGLAGLAVLQRLRGPD